MKPTPFNSAIDIPPTPFERRHCEFAAALKDAGLPWQPHVGCFVWDREGCIEVPSPFPEQVYFILNLGHFLRRFQTLENMARQLVWLPTWHQARVLYARLGGEEEKLSALWRPEQVKPASDELLSLYFLLLDMLLQKNVTLHLKAVSPS